MTTTDERIAALEAAIAKAQATLVKFKTSEQAPAAEQNAGEPAGPRLATAEHGRRVAQARFPGRTRSAMARAAGNGEVDGGAGELTGAAQGRAAARARHGSRGVSGGTA